MSLARNATHHNRTSGVLGAEDTAGNEIFADKLILVLVHGEPDQQVTHTKPTGSNFIERIVHDIDGTAVGYGDDLVVIDRGNGPRGSNWGATLADIYEQIVGTFDGDGDRSLGIGSIAQIDPCPAIGGGGAGERTHHRDARAGASQPHQRALGVSAIRFGKQDDAADILLVNGSIPRPTCGHAIDSQGREDSAGKPHRHQGDAGG